MNPVGAHVEHAAIRQHCRHLRLPTVAAQFDKLAQEALKERQTHVSYLASLLGAEVEDRERRLVERRLKEARLPRLKTLAEFDFGKAPHISVAQIQTHLLHRDLKTYGNSIGWKRRGRVMSRHFRRTVGPGWAQRGLSVGGSGTAQAWNTLPTVP